MKDMLLAAFVGTIVGMKTNEAMPDVGAFLGAMCGLVVGLVAHFVEITNEKA